MHHIRGWAGGREGVGRVAAKKIFKKLKKPNRLAGYLFAKMEKARTKWKYNKTIQW